MKGRIILAAFKQRQRRPGFYFAMVALLLLPIFFTPQSQSSFRVMLIEPKVFKQADNPSWLPIASAIIFGFFLVSVIFKMRVESIKKMDWKNGYLRHNFRDCDTSFLNSWLISCFFCAF